MNWQWKLAQYTEIRWWQHYLNDKEVEAYLVQKKAYWHRILDQIKLHPLSGWTILDAGCGPAGIFSVLNDQQVIAIDPLLSDYALKLAHFNPKDYPNVQFIPQKIEDLKQINEFDVVFCINAINHVDDLRKSIRKLSESILSGGYLVISIDVHRYRLLKYLFKVIPLDILHPHQFTLADYRKMIEANGCKVEKEFLLKPGRIFNYNIIVARKM